MNFWRAAPARRTLLKVILLNLESVILLNVLHGVELHPLQGPDSKNGFIQNGNSKEITHGCIHVTIQNDPD